MKKNPAVRERYAKIWTHIHVDEYQDTNGVQYEIVRLLVGQNKNLCVVGDIDQNIYSWRGATIENILNFEKDYPGGKGHHTGRELSFDKKHPGRGEQCHQKELHAPREESFHTKRRR